MKAKQMKKTHHLKPRPDVEMSYGIQGNSIRDVYWGTFQIWPNEVTLKIMNPKNPRELVKWLVAAGFTAEVKVITNLGLDPGNTWEDRLQEAYVHYKHKIVAINTINPNGIDIKLLMPIEQLDYGMRAIDSLKTAIGTGTPVAGRINLLALEQGDFVLMALELPKPDVNLSLSYGESFLDVDKDIREFVHGKESGLVLLHGMSGTGKSTYIYHLIHECKQKMIFIPNNVVPSMSNPDFITFMIGNAKNAVLIVEDAEKVLLKRGGAGDAGVSTLLNITDGILGKLLKLKVICTFNIERSQLDDALLRRGRLRKEHVFDKLPADDANKLFAHLGKERRTTEPMVLADIYNDAGGSSAPTPSVGFQHRKEG